MKKVLTILLASLVIAGCSKKISIQNDAECSEKLFGSWSNEKTVRTDVSFGDNEIYENSDVDGYVTFSVKSEMTFNSDLTYSTNSVTSFVSFEKENPAASTTEKDVMEAVNSSYKIEGTYKADKNQIEFISEKIIFADGSEVSFDDYVKVDASIGSKSIVVPYSVSETEFVVKAENAENNIVYKKIN